MSKAEAIDQYLRDQINDLKEIPKRVRFGWPIGQLQRPASDSWPREMAATQLRPWSGRELLKFADHVARIKEIAAETASVYVFHIHRGRVSITSKTRHLARILPKTMRRMLATRARSYEVLLRAALRHSRHDVSTVLAIDVGDLPRHYEETPIFSFQKKAGHRNILLPDPDFYNWLWYQRFVDPYTYEGKDVRAIFVGSSSGGIVRRDDLEGAAQGIPRIHLAKVFHGNPLVDFKIADATQCDSEETKRLLQQSEFFSGRIHWPEQLRKRFLLSVDGNGATCSRMVLGLLSNSVLIKYRSDSELFYFPALNVGEHYLDAQRSEEIEEIVRSELENPGRFRAVAEAGTKFAKRHLSQGSVLSYTAELVAAYSKIFRY